MHCLYDLPRWTVKPPLEEIAEAAEMKAAEELEAVT
jgi:hypothetical protein